MKYKILGNTGLKVSTLCLGTMNYGGKGFFAYMGNLEQNAVDEQIKTVTEAGVNFIDTANIYSEGLSEVMIGKAIGKISAKTERFQVLGTLKNNFRQPQLRLPEIAARSEYSMSKTVNKKH